MRLHVCSFEADRLGGRTQEFTLDGKVLGNGGRGQTGKWCYASLVAYAPARAHALLWTALWHCITPNSSSSCRLTCAPPSMHAHMHTCTRFQAHLSSLEQQALHRESPLRLQLGHCYSMGLPFALLLKCFLSDRPPPSLALGLLALLMHCCRHC